MNNFIKEIVSDDLTHLASTRRVVLLTSSITLCLGFLVCTAALFLGHTISSELLIGLATVISALAGTTYTATKLKETKLKQTEEENRHDEHDSVNHQ